MEKYAARQLKAREDLEFKKKMTERSNYSTVNGVRVARVKHYKRNEHPGYDGYEHENLGDSRASIPSSHAKKPTMTRVSKRNPYQGKTIHLT